tara:strand:+ start:315 stop:971 length:657 start_codon:yes stop_codon:yes gene_type:complete
MNVEQLVNWFEEEMKLWARNQFIANRKDTPIIYKISRLNNNPEEFIIKLKAGLSNSSDDTFTFISGLFNLKEVEKWKIIYNGKEYKQRNYTKSTTWIKEFIVDSQIPFSILFKFDTDKSVTFSKLEKDMPKSGNIVPFKINKEDIYFQHRNWGLDKLNKALDNPMRKTEGDGKLAEKINQLSEYLGKSIQFEIDGILEKWELGKYKQEIFYESNNSNL